MPPGKHRTWSRVWNHINRDKTMVLVKQSCLVCGTKKNLHAHHQDYRKPLCVVWLCVKCHNALHMGAKLDRRSNHRLPRRKMTLVETVFVLTAIGKASKVRP